MPSILMLGSPGYFSATVLSHLARAGIAQLRCAMLASSPASFAAPPASFPVNVTDPLSQAAAAFSIPLDTLAALSDVGARSPRPDLIITACFARRLPPALVAYPRCGCLNLHPSLLPAYRGPSPIFWQLRAGERRSGVTIHKLNDELDAGDIVASDSLALTPGMTAQAINARLLDLGASLLTRTLVETDWRTLPATAQNHAKASYFSWPEPADFRISSHWSARRAFQFMHGTHAWGHAYEMQLESESLLLDRALGYDADDQLPTAWARDGEALRIAFNPGVLHAVARQAPVKPDRQRHPD